MSRYFAPITESELKDKIEQTFGGNMSQIVDGLRSDIKVEFDLENYNFEGYKTLSNGLTYLGCSAGGDWEYPVFFIVYWDGKKLRAYVPTEGNPWNTKTKQAYGNDEDADGINAHKRWPDKFDGSPLDDSGCFDADDAEMEKDIMARILPVPSGLKPKPKSAKKTLQERIEALVYYAPGDEDSELFEQTCSLCYSMYGLGDTVKAETLYEWAKEQAEASKEFAEEEGRLDDFMNGHWGH